MPIFAILALAGNTSGPLGLGQLAPDLPANPTATAQPAGATTSPATPSQADVGRNFTIVLDYPRPFESGVAPARTQTYPVSMH